VMERVLAQDLDELNERRDEEGWEPDGPPDDARPAPAGATARAGEDAPARRTPPS